LEEVTGDGLETVRHTVLLGLLPGRGRIDRQVEVPAAQRRVPLKEAAYKRSGSAAAGETDLTPVKAGHSAVLDWAIYNYGSRPAEGTISYGFTLPVGVTFAKQPIGCHTQEVDGQTVAYCETPYIVLQPGKSFATPMNVRVSGDGTSTVINGASFWVAGPWAEDADKGDAGTYFEAFTRG
jgi:hypothetical protein